MIVRKIILAAVVFCWSLLTVNAQNKYFEEFQIKIDSNSYFFSTDAISYQDNVHLSFRYNRPNQIAIINFYPKASVKNKISDFQLMPSGDFTMIDSIYFFEESYYQTKVKFTNLNESQFLKFVFRIKMKEQDDEVLLPVNLLPYTNTFAELNIDDDQLFVGEQKTYEINSNNTDNIWAENRWIKDQNIEYRVSKENEKLLLHVMPNHTGTFEIELDLKTKQPNLVNNQIVYDLPPISRTFQVKSSRLRFLALDLDEVEITAPDKDQIQVQLDNHTNLQLNKTYRIENIEEPGGELYGELFVRRYLNNNRVLAWLRTYKYHHQSDGYLYVKEGDNARYITNFNIVPRTEIEKISILRQGKDWSTNLTVNPGETIILKIEGKSIHRAKFQFTNAEIVSTDPSIKNTSRVEVEIKIPINVIEKQVEILNNGEETGYSLSVKEFQKPREFDFISINYGVGKKIINEIEKPLFYENTIQDIIFSFNPNKIDQPIELYGRQYLEMNIQVTNKSNELIEIKKIDNVVVCPGENSLRYEYYAAESCQTGNINLNQILSKKTFDLPEWAKIEIEIKHQTGKYSGDGKQKTIELYNKRSYSFDIEVAFPAGLIEIAKPEEGEDNVGNLTGISMAALAQFSFYHQQKIARYLPYKIGVGFLAINAFDFNANESQRDLGIVILGSLYPTTKDVKLTFPLYFGGGYYLNREKLFFVVGPGIRLRL